MRAPCLALLLLCLACGPRRSDLEARAAVDLNCQELRSAELEQGKLGGQDRVMGVEGCGRHATYRYNGKEWIQVTGTQQMPSKPHAP